MRETLSANIKKQRKIFGLTQERLAEAAGLSSQTINDIEGCRMWVSDKTILKLAKVLQIDPYRLFAPEQAIKKSSFRMKKQGTLLNDLETKIIRVIRRQFEEAVESQE